jgi:hypothetical protein
MIIPDDEFAYIRENLGPNSNGWEQFGLMDNPKVCFPNIAYRIFKYKTT